jgi:acyl carrier protein
MDRKEILEKVTEICKDVFDNQDLILTEETCAADVKEWDSLTHLIVISDIEDEFEMSFTLLEVTASKNLGELITAIEKHLEE